MGKKILYIILGALLVFGLIFLLWSWLFSGSTKTPTDTGSLGSAGDATQTPGGTNSNNNGQTPIGSDTNGTQTIGNGQNTSGSVTNNGTGGTSGSATGTVDSSTGLANVPGITWLGSPFNATDINGVSTGAGGFAPTITSPAGSNGGIDLLTALAGTAIAGSLSCALQAGISAASLAVSTGGAAAGAGAGAGISVASTLVAVPVSDFQAHSYLSSSLALQTGAAVRNAGKDKVTFVGCITNTIAKVALQQITISVVNWINSGFNGQPAFVNNYNQFFTNVADAAAGQFIQGAGLAFLCSPFQLQIKIAIAQSYANRSAQSCTLTQVIGNVNNFMKGNFSQGGWGGLVSFTTIPTNNPYGAFAYGQIGLANAQQTALNSANKNISPTGFLNLQQLSGCRDASQNGISGGVGLGLNPQAAVAGGTASLPPGCTAKVVTPGGAIADSLGAVNKSGVDQLGLGNDIDQIINALTTQLMVRTLQNGLSSLSQTTTQTPADIAAQSQATGLLNDMQSKTTLAQQLGAIDQGSISDIETTQAAVNNLANCWNAVATSSSDPAAAANASSTNATLQSLNSQINAFNDDITKINTKIALLNDFESQISLASSVADVAAVTANYNSAVASGAFVSNADLTTAQQNRTTLQSQLATINQSTQAGLAQCNAQQ